MKHLFSFLLLVVTCEIPQNSSLFQSLRSHSCCPHFALCFIYEINENGDNVVLGKGTYANKHSSVSHCSKPRFDKCLILARRRAGGNLFRWKEERNHQQKFRNHELCRFCFICDVDQKLAVTHFLCLSQVLSAPPWRDSSAQEAETQKYCPVPGLCQSGWFHQDLHGGSPRGYDLKISSMNYPQQSRCKQLLFNKEMLLKKCLTPQKRQEVAGKHTLCKILPQKHCFWKQEIVFLKLPKGV